MQGLKYIKKEIPTLQSLRTVAQVYQETSIIKIQEVRAGVLTTREYLSGLSNIYSELKISESAHIAKLAKSTHRVDANTKSANKQAVKLQKTLFILLSANAKLYGEIVKDVYKLFIEAVKKEPDADIMIVGKLGERLFKEDGMTRQHVFIEIPDSDLQPQDLEPVIYNIVKYENVVVFHGKFLNLVTQRASRASITGEALTEEGITDKGQATRQFLFEPNLEKLMQFFETQIFVTLFRQTVHESELARYASRVNAMEESLQFIKKRQKELKSQKLRLNRSLQQKKQLERLSGMRLWRTV